jgi:hypothetical protein
VKVLVVCEFSGVVRDAFRARGHEAISCDLLPTEAPGPHIQKDIRDVDVSPFDLLICHPPCTYLATSGFNWVRSHPERRALTFQALEFVRYLMAIDKPWCIENPVSVISTRIRKPDQIIQPWMFGINETKTTCLWLNDLPVLRTGTLIAGKSWTGANLPPSADRWKARAVTYRAIADAMARQWGSRQ